MPSLDRRIVVRISDTGVNQFGEPETTTTDYSMWATRVDASAIDTATEGGSYNQSTRAYIVRWRREIAVALVSELFVIEGGVTLDVLNVIEQARERDPRRRFLRIEAIGETA